MEHERQWITAEDWQAVGRFLLRLLLVLIGMVVIYQLVAIKSGIGLGLAFIGIVATFVASRRQED